MREQITDLRSQIETECRFCNPPEKERILYETENFYVMVSLGPIVEGYLLIVSKEHIAACLNIPSIYWDDFLTLKEKVGKILTKVYGSCLFYEHGKVGTSLTLGRDHRHCFHSHLHCIPSPVHLNQIVQKEITGTYFTDITAAHNFVVSEGIDRYLLIEDSKTSLYLPQRDLRSQFLRYKFAEVIGMTEQWNWIDNQNWTLINSSIERLAAHFR